MTDLAQTVQQLKDGIGGIGINVSVLNGNMGSLLGANSIVSCDGFIGGSWDPTGVLSTINNNKINFNQPPVLSINLTSILLLNDGKERDDN
mmetsp:Transcript_8765/g.14164  ORF Transcript_8765/g.14164 Transcript_8765/m.14164 type:complete len:91 (+) Transcript_8765:109-381(+)